MSERRPQHYETLPSKKRSVQETVSILLSALHTSAYDKDVQRGIEATLRTVANIGIVCADTVPVAGTAASLAADAAKLIDNARYEAKKKEARARGEDPEKIKRTPFNLTPDVRVHIAILSGISEILTSIIPLIPTHALEASLQLRHDYPRIITAARRIHHLYKEELAKHATAEHAAKHFLESQPNNLYARYRRAQRTDLRRATE